MLNTISNLILNKLPINQSNSGLSQNRQLASQISTGFDSLQENQNYLNDFTFAHLPNQDDDDPIAFADIKAENIAKTTVKTQQDPFLLTSDIKNSLIIGTNKSSFSDSQDINALFTQTQNNISIDTFIGQKLEDHNLDGSNFQNFLFSQDAAGITKGNFGIGGRDAGILGRNISQTVAPLQKIQDISNGDSGPFDTGLAESNGLLDNNSRGNSGFDKVTHGSNYIDFATKMSNLTL